MAAYRKTRRLSPTAAAYVAGLIDGEGTITLSRRHANENRQLVVSIANTERPLLEFVLRTAGTGKVTRKRTASSKHSPSFTYSVSNKQALTLLSQVIEHLRSYKRLRAKLILDNYTNLTPRNGKYSDELLMRRERFAITVLTTTASSERDWKKPPNRS